MSVSLNDKPNRVTVSGDTVTVTAGSGIQGPQGATGPTGAGGTVAFFGNFFSTETQTNASTTAKNTFTLNSTVDSSGVSIVDSTKITFGAGTDGTYDLQFSAQFDKTDSGTDEVDIWISKNGTDLEWSNTILSLVGNNAKAVPAWNFQLNDVVAGDFFELHWWSPDSAMRVLATAAGTNPTRPAVPSLIVTVAQVTYTQVGPTGPAGATGATGPGVAAGGNTGQVLAKSSGTDYATTWVTPTPTDATYVTLSTNGTLTNERVLTAGTGISITDAGAGSTATVATSAILPTIVDAAGDLIVGTAADTVGRLAVGTDGHALTADSGSTGGLKYVRALQFAHVKVLAPRSDQGYGLFAGGSTVTSTGNVSVGAPFTVTKDATLTAVTIESTSTTANATLVIGIYATDPVTTAPTTLISSLGSVSLASTGMKTLSSLTVTLSAGITYRLAAGGGTTTGTFRGTNTGTTGLDQAPQAAVVMTTTTSTGVDTSSRGYGYRYTPAVQGTLDSSPTWTITNGTLLVPNFGVVVQ